MGLFDLLTQSPENKIKWFMTKKIKEGKESDIRRIWDQVKREEILKIVIDNPNAVSQTSEIPIRTELTVLEGDNMAIFREALHDLLNFLPDVDIESIYLECMKDAEVIAVLES